MIEPNVFDLFELYDEFKVAILTASVTIGAFIFTMKSFIVQMMKREVYDTPKFKKWLEQTQVHNANFSPVAGLRKLTTTLIVTVWIALINATLVIPLSAWHTNVSAVIGFALTSLTIVTLFIAVFIVSKNLTFMITYMEDEMAATSRLACSVKCSAHPSCECF